MAHHARVRAAGTWVSVTTVDPAELEIFDQSIFESVNGDEGGTWAPSTPIVIGGAGLDVTGQLDADDVNQLTVTGQASFVTGSSLEMDSGANLLVDCTAAFNNAADFTASVEFKSGSNVDFESGSDLDFESGSSSTWASGSNLVIDSGANVANSATLLQGGQFARVGALARSVQSSRAGSWTNSNQLQGVEYDYIEIINTSASMITLTLKIATAPVPLIDERIRVRVSGAGAGGKTIINEGSAANLAVVSGANAANFEFVFDGVAWRVFSNVGGGITLGADAY